MNAADINILILHTYIDSIMHYGMHIMRHIKEGKSLTQMSLFQ